MINVYIDEAGDEGFKIKDGEWVSSDWFIIGALIVDDKYDQDLSKTIDEVKSLIKVRPENILKPIHFTNFNHKRKKAICRNISSKKNFAITTAGFYKREIITGSYLKKKQYLYNYLCKHLLERITWYADERGEKVSLVFENRANTSYSDLNKYILASLKEPNCEIRPGVIVKWQTKNKGASKNLQIADCITSALFAALEEDEYGDVETSYISLLIDHFYRRNGNIESYGLKLLPKEFAWFKKKYPWLNII
jgi:hypothetical protein